MNTNTKLAAGALVALIGIGGVATLQNNPNFVDNLKTEIIDNSLKAGEAVYITKEGEEQNYTYEYELDDMKDTQRVLVYVTYSDGIKAGYNFVDRGFDVQEGQKNIVSIYSYFGGEIKDVTGATFEWDRNTLVITSKNGAVTKLGGFRNIYERGSSIAKANAEAYADKLAAEQAQREREQRALNNETFDEAISRFSKRVCVRAEGLSYITSNNIINNVMNPMIRSGELQMSSSNWARWNNMNPQLRSKNVLNAMNWDCNNVMMMAYENDINNAVWGYNVWLNNL